MDKLSRITQRLPGGTYFKNLIEIAFKNTSGITQFSEEFKQYKKFFIAGYFFAAKARNRQRAIANQLQSLRDCGEYYDFFIIKLPKDEACDALLLTAETQNMIIPYVYQLNPDFGHEGSYEQHGIYVETGDIVIDAGANIGIFTAFAAGYRDAGKVYAFEPVAENASVLESTIQLNGIDHNTEIVKKALSNETQQGSISVAFSGSSIIEYRQKGMKLRTIQMTTLDDFVKEKSLKHVDFIKADIEGAERLMLKGAKQTLKKYKPKLALCTYHYPDDPKILTELILEANPTYDIHYSEMKLFAK